MFFYRFLFSAFLRRTLFLCIVGGALWAQAMAAVVLQYHRFGDARYPSTNVTMAQFRAQLDYLRTGGFTVLPLPQIIAALQSGESLGDKVVALTIDDAYLSVHTHALPLLRAYGFPVTLFIVPHSHSGGGDYMSWEQLRDAVAGGLVSIGSQTLSHAHLPLLSAAALRRELHLSAAAIQQKLGVAVELLAYPYGEASLAVMAAAREAGYRAAFGQHSGALGESSDMFYLPRFAVNEAYGDISQLQDKINSLPLAVTRFSPPDPVIGDSPITVRMRLADNYDAGALQCYHSHFGAVSDKRISADNEVILSFAGAFAPGRSRLNCTLPGANRRWHWFGWQFVRYVEGRAID